MSVESGIVAAGLCSVSGMLPDLDSDSGYTSARNQPFYLCSSSDFDDPSISRSWIYGRRHGGRVDAAVHRNSFCCGGVFKRYTVHRGMWHSVPAAAVAGLIAYLVMPCQSDALRVYKSLAVVLGFMVHLVMDEIWSVDTSGGIRFKKSFGTALKFFGSDTLANVSVYGKLLLLLALAWEDGAIVDRIKERSRQESTYIAQPYFDFDEVQRWITR